MTLNAVVNATAQSPFDAIRHVNEHGEVWSARELMPVMGYGADWRNFADAINRATAACRNAGYDPADHIGDATKMVRIGSGAQRAVPDFRLTRFGAYLVAMNGDPRKPEIAAAQTYFAVKTREAETGVHRKLSNRELAQMVIEEADRAERAQTLADRRGQQLAIAAPKVEYVNNFVTPDDDASLIRVFAAQLGVGERSLRDWLRARKVLYRRVVGRRWSRSRQQVVDEHEWLAYSDHQTWFKPVDQPTAPRLHNGQMATTLYVTPVGKVGIRRLLMQHPIESP